MIYTNQADEFKKDLEELFIKHNKLFHTGIAHLINLDFYDEHYYIKLRCSASKIDYSEMGL